MKRLMMCLVVLLLIAGCDGGDDDGGGDDINEGVNVSGVWEGDFDSDNRGSATVEIEFTQSGDTLTGTATLISSSLPACAEGVFEGTIIGDIITGTLDVDSGSGGGDVEINATVIDDNTIQGTYDVDGGACNGDSGEFEIVRS